MNGRETAITVILILVVIALFGFVNFYGKKNVAEADAKKFIEEDLANKYPGADIETISVNEKFNEKNEKYFEIKAKVTENLESACPARIHIYYNYPEQNFVPQAPEYITKGCEVCRERPCVIAFPEEAIIASHTLAGTAAVSEYLQTYSDAAPSFEKFSNFWNVTWDSGSAGYYYKVGVSTNGNVLSVAKISKTASPVA